MDGRVLPLEWTAIVETGILALVWVSIMSVRWDWQFWPSSLLSICVWQQLIMVICLFWFGVEGFLSCTHSRKVWRIIASFVWHPPVTHGYRRQNSCTTGRRFMVGRCNTVFWGFKFALFLYLCMSTSHDRCLSALLAERDHHSTVGGRRKHTDGSNNETMTLVHSMLVHVARPVLQKHVISGDIVPLARSYSTDNTGQVGDALVIVSTECLGCVLP